jgi:hypothetical protein
MILMAGLLASPAAGRAPAGRGLAEVRAFFECFEARTYTDQPGQLVSPHPASLRVQRRINDEATIYEYAVPAGLRLFGLTPSGLGQSEIHWATFAETQALVADAVARRWPNAVRTQSPDGYVDFAQGGRNITVTRHRVPTGGEVVHGADVHCSM